LLIRYFVRGVTTGMAALTPRFSHLEGVADRNKICDLLLRSLWVSAALAAGGAILLLLCGRPFLEFWVGAEFNEAAPVLSVLAISYAFALSQNPTVRVFYAINKHHFFAVLAVAEAILNLGLSLVLVRYYGIIGVAIGTAVPMFLIKVIVQPTYLSRCLEVSLADYYRRLLPPSVALLVGLVVLIMYFR